LNNYNIKRECILLYYQKGTFPRSLLQKSSKFNE